jgi:hypothetical protein
MLKKLLALTFSNCRKWDWICLFIE